MIANKIEIDANHDARLDACLEEIVEIFRDGAHDAESLDPIMALRHGLPNSEAIELVQLAIAVKQQQ